MITVNNLSFSYGKNPFITDMNFSVSKGEIFGFLGPSGAGTVSYTHLSGMHVHMLLFKEGRPVFYDKDGYSSLSQTAHYFIGGLLKHAPSLCAWTNPSTNSYKRLVPGFEAPVTIGYATSNRSAVIRIPAYAKAPEDKRFELRSPDATANPYYAYAAILMADVYKRQVLTLQRTQRKDWRF